MASLITDFFGDVVCCWCFNISSRMRGLADKLDIDGRHRAFILRASRAEVAARWESPKNARKTILGHWPVCPQGGNRTELVDIDAMRAAPFDFSRAMTAALGCKAAELLGGQATHWDMFDRLQRAHLTEARNIADPGVVLRAAQELGFDEAAFALALGGPATDRAVKANRHHARALQIRSIPAVIFRETGAWLTNGPLQDLVAQLRSALRLVA